MDYRKLLFIGFLLVLTGFVVPFLMVMRVIQPSFFWCFLSYACSISGLFLGLIGNSRYVSVHRKPKDDPENFYQSKKR